MGQYNLFMNDELESGKAGQKIQKIIFDIIFQYIQDMVFVMKVESGPVFRYLFINEAGMRKANLSVEVIGKTMQEVLPADMAASLQHSYENLLLGKKTVVFEDVFTIDDQKIQGQTILTPIYDETNTIRYVVAVTRDITMIQFMAFHDQLTGLYNRRALLEHLNDWILSQRQKSHEFALISIDLDRFKYLNDTLGHLAGDEILKTVATRLMQFQNEACRIYRTGGDEFTVLLSGASRSITNAFVRKVFSAFSDSFYLNSQEYFISPSIGISMYPNDGKDAETLIKNADEALFRVKERGKAHYQFYRSDMNNVLTNVVTLETHLRKAIDKDELSLVYQPQIEIPTEKAKSFEALLRWKNPDFGNISPSTFIPLAEETGLIISIGYWVIETACRQIKTWSDKGYSDLRIAVNISPKQIQQPNLVSYIKRMIEKYQISPTSLEIEITEGAMREIKETIPILTKLKELGISISVDDFGTGYSSLNYLKKFPIDGLKIDKSFIKDILNDPKDAAITTTIIHLGKSLGLEVIAEGVEEKEQVDFLLQSGCQKIQGYYFSRPVSATDVELAFLEKPINE
jgi:diguanylate cyclase (GGDEF)-like protein/PAS domain S-box-containing protein